jgi:hypothetical protein
MKNITHTLVYADIRFKHGRIRWYTLAYGPYGEARRDRNMLKNFVRIRTYSLYDKLALGARWIGYRYARCTVLVHWHFKGWSPVFYKANSILATIPTTSLMFCRKIFQWVTKGEDVPSFHNGSRISLLCMERAYTNTDQWRKFGRGCPRSYRDWVPPRQGDDRFFWSTISDEALTIWTFC